MKILQHIIFYCKIVKNIQITMSNKMLALFQKWSLR
nr:MAG TPA: hypothetical protein [Caudoviricetes sp.]